MKQPDPERGVFRWAARRAGQRRTSFWIGAAALSLVIAAGGAFVVLPTNPSVPEKLLAGLGVVVAAIVLIVFCTFVWSLLAAPYEQRDELRRRIVDLRAANALELQEASRRLAELEPSRVSAEHGKRLRELAKSLAENVRLRVDLDYGPEGSVWRLAFAEHFPTVGPALEKMASEDQWRAYDLFRDRLLREACDAGFCEPNWFVSEFGEKLAFAIYMRCLEREPQATLCFDWRNVKGVMYLFSPLKERSRIVRLDAGADWPSLRGSLEGFVKMAESWPEARRIGVTIDRRREAEREAIVLLEVAANTDPITSRCVLCRQA